MTKLRTLLAAILGLLIPLAHADTWRDHIEVTSTEFSNGISLFGKTKDQGETTDRYTYVMFATVEKKTGDLIGAGFGLLNTHYSKGWRRWHIAATSQAEQLQLTRNRADSRLCSRTGCFLDEKVTILLPLTALKQAASEPMRIRMSGQAPGAEFTFPIDSREAQSLLEAIKETAAAQRTSN